MRGFWRVTLSLLLTGLCWAALLATVTDLVARPIRDSLSARLGHDPVILGRSLSQGLAAGALLLASFFVAALVSWCLRHLRGNWLSRCPACRSYLAPDNDGVCPACGASTRRGPSPTGRPLIVRKAVCSLCTTTLDVPVEAHHWARCPNCGALVPI